jgi:hypothetical protein
MHSKEELQAQVDELKAEFEKLKNDTDRTAANLQLEYCVQVDELHIKLSSAEQKILLLEQSYEGEWVEFKTELDLIWHSMRELIKAINSA